jgi:short-subunit dehydrogenase
MTSGHVIYDRRSFKERVMLNLRGAWALVTGASSGLGVEFARALAARGTNLVLTARREAPMQDLAAALRNQHGIDVRVFPCDLALAGSTSRLLEQISAQGLEPDILINNAGFGLHGRFLEQDAARLADMLQVDVVAPTELALALGRQMHSRGGGGILMVASLAAYSPTPLYAAYGAAKAYLLSLGEALHVELAPSVKVSVLSPGLMDTGFLQVSGQQATPAMRRYLTEPRGAVMAGLNALLNDRASTIPGRLNQIGVFMYRLMSRAQQARLMLRMQQGATATGRTAR